ncbi:MAG: hypothetical protein M1838_001940 [Thelocarpon superellum]|nr:MAG: hypothetical protein M1838_001940 [Thelocarpon superellum]
MATVIVGAGIIGVSTAYYLASSGAPPHHAIHLVETSPRLFASASGFAAGFLARDWFDASLAELGALSFALHQQLAEQYGGDDSDPLRLCRFLLGECQDHGVQLHHPARVLSIARDLRGELASVRILADNDTETDLPCTHLIITAGAWTPQVFSALFPTSTIHLPISPYAGHSLIVRSPRWTERDERAGCHAVFATDPDGFSPELFSRIGREIYVSGLNSTTISLPAIATDAQVDPASMVQLRKVAARLVESEGAAPTHVGDELEVVREGVCFRPVSATGHPFLFRVPDEQLGAGVTTRAGRDGGVFIAAGHGPWGISLSLGTGKVLAELVEGRPTSVTIEALAL